MMTAAEIARKMLQAELEVLARRRRQMAIEHPRDRRNYDSAAEYDRLAKTVKDVPDDLMIAHSESVEATPQDAGCWCEMLRDIYRGLRAPTDARELVQAFLDRERNEDANP